MENMRLLHIDIRRLTEKGSVVYGALYDIKLNTTDLFCQLFIFQQHRY